MDNPETVFHKTVGCVIANKIANEYNGYMSQIYHEMGNKYLRNKCDDAVRASDKLIARLKIIDKGLDKAIEEYVQFNSDMIFDITAMDPEDQKRIANLIKKIKRERKS